MMKKMLFALLVLTVSVVPALAAEDGGAGMQGGMGHGEMHMKHQHPEMQQHPGMQQMMQNPQHLLAMAYHKNLVNFAQALRKVARQGDTVPKEFARAAVVEMRRSADQMEMYHEQAARSLPPELKAKHAAMAKDMAAHLTEMRDRLAQLDELTKRDRIDSKELLQQLNPLLKGAEMCGPAMHGHGPGMPGGGMKCGCMGNMGAHGCGMPGRGCRHDGCRHQRPGCGAQQGCQWHGPQGMSGGPGRQAGQGAAGWHEMMQQRDKMMATLKVQDAELSRLVDAMNRAPEGQKQRLLAEIVTRMVQQRSETLAQMDQLQEHLKRHMAQDGSSDFEDADVDDNDDTHADDMDSDDAGSGDGDMDMNGMQMEE